MLSIFFYFFLEGILIANNGVVSLQIFALIIILWARKTLGIRSFEPTASPIINNIVMSGPYKFIRHPIYFGASLFIWAGVISYPSILNVFLGIVVTVMAFIRAICEEKLIIQNSNSYKEYMLRTKRIIPYLF
jgi:protein-S-isoprenylcysteine O-methyltransferase Ste14